MKRFLLAALICLGVVTGGVVGGVDVMAANCECIVQPYGEVPPVYFPPPIYAN